MKKLDNQCAGKTKYNTRHEANEAVKHLNQKKGRRVNSYKCSECLKFHYGHETKPNKMTHLRGEKIDFTHESKIHIVDLENLNLK